MREPPCGGFPWGTRQNWTLTHNIVIIGKGVLTGPHVFIADHNHEYRNPDVYIYKQGCRAGKDDRVLIDDGTWLGTNVVVVGNVHIGKQCVIGANSVVTKDIPDYCVAAQVVLQKCLKGTILKVKNGRGLDN